METKIVEVDQLGRVQIALKEIQEKDKFEIYEEKNSIILRKLNVKREKEIFTDHTYTNDDTEIHIQIYKIKTEILDLNDKNHIVRVADELRRVVIPIEFRTKMNIKEKDKINLNKDGNIITLTKKD